MATENNVINLFSGIGSLNLAIRDEVVEEAYRDRTLESFLEELHKDFDEFIDEVLESVLNRIINGEDDDIEYFDVAHWAYIIHSWDFLSKMISKITRTLNTHRIYNGTDTEIANCTLLI